MMNQQTEENNKYCDSCDVILKPTDAIITLILRYSKGKEYEIGDWVILNRYHLRCSPLKTKEGWLE